MLKESWAKVLCKECITDLVKEETTPSAPVVQQDLLSSFRKDLADTFESFKSYLDKRPATGSSVPRSQSSVSAYRGDSDSEEENRSVATESEEEAEEERIFFFSI